MHSRQGSYFTGDPLKAGGALSPWEGLPLSIIEQVGDDPVAGTGGLLYYFNHFLRWEGPLAEGAAGGWTLSGVTGAATITQPNTRIGEIILTSDATANCDPTLQLGGAAAPAPFLYAVGKRIWVAARLKFQTVGSQEFFFGVATPDTEPTTSNTFPSDGIFFHKAAAATKLSFDARKDGTSTSKATITGTLVDDTYTTIGFCVNTRGDITPYQDGVAIPAGIIVAGTANIPSAAADVMQFEVGFRVASKTLTFDWLLLAQDI